ncbi:MAG TPA: hypothetical protein VKX41_16285 [Alloacidobacterium sp.]|nr:hypothetical protein [Alloacidobacterium sp.]
MRIIAVLRAAETWQDQVAREVSLAFSRHSLIETDDAAERTDIIDALIADMSEVDLHRFQRTVRFVARHALDGTVASVSVLDNKELLLRLRNPQLRLLVPTGHALLVDLLTEFGAGEHPKLSLTHCEIRERGGGHNDGFLFAEWKAGTRGLFSFLYGNRNRRLYFLGITLLFIVGLSLEVILTLNQNTSPLAQLGQRLGAPMLVSSSVLMLERLAQWLNERSPSLRWTPTPPREIRSPLLGSFEPMGD